jgi:hypothetical protein
MVTWFRTMLRKVITWALAGAPETPHDAAGLDKIASDSHP